MLLDADEFGDDIDGDDDLGVAPAVAVALPFAKTAGLAVGKKVFGKLFGKKSAPPPKCTFGQRLSKIFGGKPNCS